MKRSQIEIGKKVIFWQNKAKDKFSDPVLTEITSEVYGAGGGCCELKDHGMQPIDNIQKVNAGNLLFAKHNGCKGIGQSMINDLLFRPGKSPIQG